MPRSKPKKTKTLRTDEEKRAILAEVAANGSGVTCEKYGITYNALSTWRRQLKSRPAAASQATNPTGQGFGTFEDYTKAVESWIRAIAREEVSKVLSRLTKEE